MFRSFLICAFAGFPFALAAFGAPSPTLAANPPASLFICDVPATSGGCANGASSPEGFVRFDFSAVSLQLSDSDGRFGGNDVAKKIHLVEACYRIA